MFMSTSTPRSSLGDTLLETRRRPMARTVVVLTMIFAAAFALSGGSGDARIESVSLVLLGTGLLGTARLFRPVVAPVGCQPPRESTARLPPSRLRDGLRPLGPVTPMPSGR